MRELTYADALREALREEMLRDRNVVLLGEEIGVFEGAYKVTRGLLKEFGPDRVKDTPISEAAIVGVAIGAALSGLRPVAEMMYFDFVPLCLDQIVTQAAKMRFMSGGQLSVPLVVRTQYSLGRIHGSQHSQFCPSWLTQSAGLNVVLPSTPYDAKGLLKSSIRDDNPVVFIESGVLYRKTGEVPEDDYLVPLGKADVKRSGEDVTIVAFSRVVQEALAAAEKLEEAGIEAEVVDPRTAQPMDTETISASVKKTGRLVVASDDSESGLAASVSAFVNELAFDYLDAPIKRVCSPNIPTPFSPTLEQEFMVNSHKIASVVQSLVG